MIAVLYFALLIHQYRLHALLLHPSTNTAEILIFPRFHKEDCWTEVGKIKI